MLELQLDEMLRDQDAGYRKPASGGTGPGRPPASLSGERLVTRAEEAVGPLDILVNNAGVEIASSFTLCSEDELRGILAVDLIAPLMLIHQVLPGMLARKRGHVVNICSLASKGALPYGVPYAAAKAGLAGVTQSLRAEYAGRGVGFSTVIPGFVTGAGIFARHEENGIRAPRLFGTITPEKVGRAVVEAIRRDPPEILVTPRPLRPLLALAALAPRIGERLAQRVGVKEVSRAVARRNGRLEGVDGLPATTKPMGPRTDVAGQNPSGRTHRSSQPAGSERRREGAEWR